MRSNTTCLQFFSHATAGVPAATVEKAFQLGAFGGGLVEPHEVLVMLVAMIAFSMFSGRKQKKLRQSMLSALKKHDQVVTRGGVFGSVVEVKSDRVVLKVDESSNTRITVTRDSIDQVMAEAEQG